MVPKIHAKGSSFKGAAAYLLHDKGRADTSERVEWTEARNLAVDDPDMAWRVMAATAMDQDRLKAEAGVKRTGQKSDKHVLHVSLAWHPDQAPTREEMVAAADGAIEALGATKHQALYVAHSDEKHPHLHLLINRVSPEDGRHLSSSNDRLKLSKWAEAYEKAGGKVLCENRVINNEARAKGEYVKGARDVSRHIFEKQPANDNDFTKGVADRQRAKDHAEAQKDRETRAAQAAAWKALREERGSQMKALSDRLATGVAKAKHETREAFRPEWRTLNKRQEAERKTFDALEQSFFGRAGNIVRTVRLTARDVSDEPRSGVISRSFRILTNAGERRTYFEAAQKRARTSLERRQADRVSEAVSDLKKDHRGAVEAVRADYLKKREALVKASQAETRERKAAWARRNEERESAFDKARELVRSRGRALAAFQNDGDKPRSAKSSKRRDLSKAFKRARNMSRNRGKDRDQERER